MYTHFYTSTYINILKTNMEKKKIRKHTKI